MYLAEHDQYRQLLKTYGIAILELGDFVEANGTLMNTLASLPYLNDSSVISEHGAILSQMGWGRAGEERVVKEALAGMGIPIMYQFEATDQFEGCLILPKRTLLIVRTERHRKASIEKFLPTAVAMFNEVIYVECPMARRFMHEDMAYGQISEGLALAFLPAINEAYHITSQGARDIDFVSHMTQLDIEIINISDQEQKTWGCSFVAVEPKLIIHYDIALAAQTLKILAGKGVEIVEFHPSALLAGGGSLRCLTLQVFREGSGRANSLGD
jgi:arginine deiminase